MIHKGANEVEWLDDVCTERRMQLTLVNFILTKTNIFCQAGWNTGWSRKPHNPLNLCYYAVISVYIIHLNILDI